MLGRLKRRPGTRRLERVDMSTQSTSCVSALRKYLFKLGIANGGQQACTQADSVYKPREERPQQHCTLIIFDWDDTLLCTSALQSPRPPKSAELFGLEVEAVKLFELAKTLGQVIIITNAITGACKSPFIHYVELCLTV